MLPLELYDYIIDFCHNDLDGLRACSLASHALRGSSKYHVFRSITIDGLEVLNRFCQLVCTSPDIASLVQELYFNTYRHFMRQETFIWIHHTAAFPVNRLTRLKTVGFSYVRFGHLAEYPVMPAFYQNLTRYRGVRELRISSCDFEHMDALEDFIWRFAPQSEQTHTRAPAPPFALTLDCVTWGIPERITPSRADLCLTSLTIDNYSMPDLITMWLLRTPSPNVLRAVTFKCMLGWELDRVGTFLRSLGNVLEHLQLGIRLDSVPWPIDIRNHFDLAQNVNLRSLHLRILDLDRRLMSWVPALLLQVAHVPLQSLIFDIWLYVPTQLDSPVWDEIEAALSSNPFKTVQTVLFVHRGALQFAEARRALQKRLPVLVQRRVLTVRDCSKPLH